MVFVFLAGRGGNGGKPRKIRITRFLGSFISGKWLFKRILVLVYSMVDMLTLVKSTIL